MIESAILVGIGWGLAAVVVTLLWSKLRQARADAALYRAALADSDTLHPPNGARRAPGGGGGGGGPLEPL